jgi:GMP synthase-like glutamine amidotransferase
MNVLILKNIANEGPGTIEEYLREERISYSIVDLRPGERLPDVNHFTHLIIMGGPMAVYEMERHSFLREEADFILKAVKSKMHVLGICLGAQMLAHVLGAKVYSGGRKEIGWYQAAITPEGMRDPVMVSLALEGRPEARVFQWHGDTFDIPKGAVRLASSDLFPNQAFRYSNRVYALQFHIEVTPAIVLDWLKNEKEIDLRSMKEESDRIYPAYRVRAMNFYRRFFNPGQSFIH